MGRLGLIWLLLLTKERVLFYIMVDLVTSSLQVVSRIQCLEHFSVLVSFGSIELFPLLLMKRLHEVSATLCLKLIQSSVFNNYEVFIRA